MQRMQLKSLLSLAGVFILSACTSSQGQNAVDPFEPVNRATFKFNRAFDATLLKPVAKLYITVLPQLVRDGVDNFFNNIAMIPTVGNDLLQGEFRYAIKDTWRFAVNSTIGVGGVFDVASRSFSLPAHYNDLGMTFYKWGYHQSSYFMVPFLGPSTIRDTAGISLEYFLMTPYPYIHDQGVVWGLWGLRYVDLRSQLFEHERLMEEAIDPYTFVRDAWLQHREYAIHGGQSQVLEQSTQPESVQQSDKGMSSQSAALGGDYVD
jgi:phospholipid-binding lipoprotein MlaA